MSTLVRFVLSSVLVALFSVGTLPAQAQTVPVLEQGAYSSFTTIRYIRQNQTLFNDETYFALNGVACTNGAEFYFEASAAAHESMVDIALAAFIANRQVLVVHYGCRVQSLYVR